MLQTAAETITSGLPMPDLYRRVERYVPPLEWPVFADDIAAILDLKRQRNAVVLAHNYQTPEIFHTVADIVGDSLALAREAVRTDAAVIVLAGVHFMAETAKLLNPEKIVLIPDPEAGCSLAASITAADIRLMRERHPGVPIVTYVNTSAAVKAELDVCCTSGNARKIIEALGAPRVIMLPDEYLARNTAAQTKVEIIAWKGHCEVHERFTANDVRSLRASHPGLDGARPSRMPARGRCRMRFHRLDGSNGRLCRRERPSRVVLLTECSMSDNVALQYPDLDFVRPCNLCPHMKRITLPKIRHALETMTHEITVAPEVAARARRAVERMLALG